MFYSETTDLHRALLSVEYDHQLAIPYYKQEAPAEAIIASPLLISRPYLETEFQRHPELAF